MFLNINSLNKENKDKDKYIWSHKITMLLHSERAIMREKSSLPISAHHIPNTGLKKTQITQ